MSIGKMEDSMEIIRKLADYPNTENDLSAEELKALFDKGPELIKSFINNIIVPAINNLETNGSTEKPDTTLSVSGKAADAAAVSVALAEKADAEAVAEALAGKAPAGYGLGEVIRNDTARVADLNNSTLKTGFYYCTAAVANPPDDSFGGGPLLVVNWMNDTLVRQYLMNNDLSVTYTRRYKDGTWYPWEYIHRDTGWIDLALDDAFTLYEGKDYNRPRYRVSGNVVTVRGAVSPKVAFKSSSTKVVMASGIPAEYRPAAAAHFVCQGSVMNRWCCSIDGSTGEVALSKYGTTEYAEVPTDAWLHFFVTYQIGG